MVHSRELVEHRQADPVYGSIKYRWDYKDKFHAANIYRQSSEMAEAEWLGRAREQAAARITALVERESQSE